MKIPRGLSSDDLIKLLNNYGYNITRRIGSHVRLTSSSKGKEHYITMPSQKSLKVATLNNIIGDIAEYLEIEKKDLMKKLFG